MKKVLCLLVLGISILAAPAYAQSQSNLKQDLYTDLQNQLSSAVDEINRLQAENYKLKNSKGNLTGAAAGTSDSKVVQSLQQQLKQKNHEAYMLRQQLGSANSNMAQSRCQSGQCQARSSRYNGISNNHKKKNFFKRVFRRR